MTELLGATSLLGDAVSTTIPGGQNTATAAANAATTVASAANAAASTVLGIKEAWSSPSNCLHSNYCRIPVAIIIVFGISIIVCCLCCIKGCADCLSCLCCCCRSSARSRERLRPPDPQAYVPTNYGYGQQPPSYQPRNTTPGGGNLFPMPERPKYEPIRDEEQGIKLNDMRPQHAYLDGDNVVSDPHIQTDTTPIVPAAAPPPAARMPRVPTAPYPLTDDGYHTPPPALLPGAGISSGRASPVRRDYQSSPVRSAYNERPSYNDDYFNQGASYNRSYDTGYHGGGGYQDDHEPYYYENNYENTRGGYGGSRGGGFNV